MTSFVVTVPLVFFPLGSRPFVPGGELSDKGVDELCCSCCIIWEMSVTSAILKQGK